jgi:hypothetical protein
MRYHPFGFLVAAVLLFPGPALAQGFGRKFSAIIGGATLSDLSTNINDSKSRWGGTAGLMIGVNQGRTAITLEGLWVQKGGEGVRLDYIDVPLTFGAAVPAGGGATRIRFYSGIAAAFKIGCAATEALCEDANSTEWTIPAGLQVARMTGDKFIGLDVRYGFALSDAFDSFDGVNRTWYFRVFVGRPAGG